jgi:hypothetical protein
MDKLAPGAMIYHAIYKPETAPVLAFHAWCTYLILSVLVPVSVMSLTQWLRTLFSRFLFGSPVAVTLGPLSTGPIRHSWPASSAVYQPHLTVSADVTCI